MDIKEIDTTSEKDKSMWKAITPANYDKGLLLSIIEYTNQAQTDIVDILYKFYSEQLKKDASFLETPLAKNISFRILQLYYEALDSMYLLCEAILQKNRSNKYLHETYLNANTTKTEEFFIRCANGELSDVEVLAIWGLSEIDSIESTSEKVLKRLDRVRKDVLEKEVNNFKVFGKKYIDIDRLDTRNAKSSVVRGVTSVKHGFKVFTHYEVSSEYIKFEPGELAVVQGTKMLRSKTFNEDKRVIEFGFLSAPKTMHEVVESLTQQIRDLSGRTKIFAELQLEGYDDPFNRIALLDKRGVIKMARNDPCPCNSGKKYKYCHGAN